MVRIINRVSLAYFVTFVHLILVWVVSRLRGSYAPAPASPKSTTSQNRAGQRSRAPRTPRVRLSRVTGPRLALRVIADSVGQVSGFPRQPHDARDLGVAWLQLGDLVAGFVQAQIALGETVPQFLASKDEDAQFERLAIMAKQSPMTFVRAIWREAAIRASLQATTVLAHRVQRLFRGTIPKAERTKGPAGEQEWYVVDSMDRPVICRLLEHDDGRLEILDGGGDFLHNKTLALSCWRLAEGWLPAPGFRNRRNDGGDGLPNPEPRPNPAQPKI
jgi:hypothetical protein